MPGAAVPPPDFGGLRRGRLTYLPVVPGKLEFAAHVRRALLEQRLMRIEAVHSSLRAVLARMARALLVVIAVLVSLSLVGIDLTVLSVFGGALGHTD